MKKQQNLEVKSVKEIMEQMGFNSKSPVTTQRAFIKHLMKSAYNLDFEIKEEDEKQLDLFDVAS